MASDRIKKSVQVSLDTGLSSSFVYDNLEELERPFGGIQSWADVDPITDPDEPPAAEGPVRQQLESGYDHRTLFQRAFGGYDLSTHMPYGYEKMDPLQRALYRANAAAKVLLTRAGYRLAKPLRLISEEDAREIEELEGVFAAEDLERMQRLTDPAAPPISDPVDVPDDKPQNIPLTPTDPSILGKKPQYTPTETEQVRMAMLEEDALKLHQKSPEAAAVMAQYMIAGGLFNELLSASKLGAVLDNAGRTAKLTIAKNLRISQEASKMHPWNRGVKVLADMIEKTPRLATDIFATETAIGAAEARPKSPEDAGLIKSIGEGAARGRVALAWAPVFFLPGFSKAAVPKHVQNVVQAAMGRVSAGMSRVTAPLLKPGYVKASMKAFEQAYMKQYNVVPTDDIMQAVKKQISNSVDEALNAARKNTPMRVLEDAASTARASRPGGTAAVLPGVSLADAADDAAREVSRKASVFPFLTEDGTYVILNSDTQQEIFRNVKPNQLEGAIEQAVVKSVNQPRAGIMRRTKRQVVEEYELKRTMRNYGRVAREAYRSGQATEKQKSLTKAIEAKEKIALLKQDKRDMLTRQKAASMLVSEQIPLKERGVFINRILGAKTDKSLNTVIDDVNKRIDQKVMNESIKLFRRNIKDLQGKYGKDFVNAPDDVRDVLVKLDNAVTTKRGKATISDADALADDVKKLSVATREVIGDMKLDDVPQTLLDELTRLSTATDLTANDVTFLANVAQMAAFRSQARREVFIRGKKKMLSDAISDTESKIIPRQTKPEPRGRGPGKYINKLWGVESDHPITLIEKMTGRNSMLMDAMMDYYDGERVAAMIKRDGYSLFHDSRAKKGIGLNKVARLVDDVDLSIGGKNVKIERGELLALGMTMRDPHGYNRLKTTKGIYIRGKRVANNLDEVEDDIAKALSKLDNDDWGLGEIFFETNANVLMDPLNETHYLLNGTRRATSPVNYPVHRFNTGSKSQKYSFNVVENQSRVMPRSGGTGPVEIRNFLTDYLDNINQVANYHGKAIPARSLRTILGDDVLKTKLHDAGYRAERDNLLKIIDTDQGLTTDRSLFDAFGGELLNRFTTAILAGRVSTVLVQHASLPAMQAVIPAKYWRPQDLLPKSEKAIQKLMDDNPFFWDRFYNKHISLELGHRATSTATEEILMGKTRLTDKALSSLVWSDKRAIGSGLNPAKRMAKKTGEDYSRILERAVREGGQPVWGITNRSAFASDKSGLKHAFAMFRTAQEAQLNVAKRALIRYQRDGKVGPLVNDMTAVFEAGLAVALYRNLWRKARTDAISGLSGWLGQKMGRDMFIPQEEESFAFETAKGTTKNVIGLFPGGPQLAEAIDVAVAKFVDDYEYTSYSSDPFTTMAQAAMEVVDGISGLIKKYKSSLPEGVSAKGRYLHAVDVDVKVEDWVKAMLPLLKATTLYKGKVGPAPIGEWIYPGIKRSDKEAVNLVGESGISRMVETQALLEKFLDRHRELKEKEQQRTLTEKETDELLSMPTKAIDMMVKFDDPKLAATVQNDLFDYYNIGE